MSLGGMPGPRTGLAHDVNARRRGAALGERLANSALSVNVACSPEYLDALAIALHIGYKCEFRPFGGLVQPVACLPISASAA
jgi:hypothetical protein